MIKLSYEINYGDLASEAVDNLVADNLVVDSLVVDKVDLAVVVEVAGEESCPDLPCSSFVFFFCVRLL